MHSVGRLPDLQRCCCHTAPRLAESCALWQMAQMHTHRVVHTCQPQQWLVCKVLQLVLAQAWMHAAAGICWSILLTCSTAVERSLWPHWLWHLKACCGGSGGLVVREPWLVQPSDCTIAI